MNTLKEIALDDNIDAFVGNYVRITRPRYSIEGKVLQVYRAYTQMFYQIQMQTHEGIALVPYHFRADTYTILTEEAYKERYDFQKRIAEGTVFTKRKDVE